MFDQCRQRQKDVDHAFMNAIIEPLLGRIEPRLGIIKPLLGRIEVRLGTVEPVEGLKKLYFENVFRRVRKSAAVELSILLSNEPSEKAVGYFYRQNHFRSSSALENVSVHLTKSMDVGFLLSSRESDTDRHFKIAKRIKRRRDREPSRISMKKVWNSCFFS